MVDAARLCSRQPTLEGAIALAHDCLVYLSGLVSTDVGTPASGLILRTCEVDGVPKSLRPLNPNLLIPDPLEFAATAEQFVTLLADLKASGGVLPPAVKQQLYSSRLVSRTLYTLLQSVGFSMDCLLEPNKARKNFGTRFEEIMRDTLGAVGVGQSPMSFSLPYVDMTGAQRIFRNQVDLVIAATSPVQSASNNLYADEVVVSLKTSSKDRFAKIFLDREMLQFVTGHDVPTLAIFHNDVQRSGNAKTSGTFVAGNFVAYVQNFGALTGVYYVDPPPHINIEPWSAHLRTIDRLILDDIWSVVF